MANFTSDQVYGAKPVARNSAVCLMPKQLPAISVPEKIPHQIPVSAFGLAEFCPRLTIFSPPECRRRPFADSRAGATRRCAQKLAHLRKELRIFEENVGVFQDAHFRKPCASSNKSAHLRQGTALDPLPLRRKVAQQRASASIAWFRNEYLS
jgi:hypothetical protein